MSAPLALSLPIAHHPLVSALPFFAPALVIVGGLLVLRAMERRREGRSRP